MGGAVFLDRDGVINVDRPDYVKAWSEFEFLPGTLEALRALAAGPLPVFVVTNQACIGRGLVAAETIEDIHRRMRETAAAAGGRIDGVYCCPHAPGDGCACRKPRPGLLQAAAAEHGLDLAASWLVGDNRSDLEAAEAAGVGRRILVRTGKGTQFAEQVERERRATLCPDLRAAAARILAPAR